MTTLDIVYFELNNWICGKSYPNAEPFLSWLTDFNDIKFDNINWIKKNKICVVESIIDMSINFCITATKEWVDDNCPELLTKYMEFLRFPDEYGDVEGKWGNHFKEWSEDNIGLYYEYEDKESGQWIEE